MMESTQDRYRNDTSERLCAPEVRRIFAQRQMGPDVVVIRSISFERPAQVGLAEHHDVVEALAPDRADQPLRMSILPR